MVTYTPAPNYNGNDSFAYQVCDATGLCDAATVIIIIDPVNDPPRARDQSVSATEDASTAFALVCNDVDGDAVNYVVLNPPPHGTLSGIAPNLTYTPDKNYNGDDSFSFQCSDGQSVSDSVTISISVRAVDDDPVAVDDASATNEDTPVTIDAVANDSDVDGNLDLNTLSILTDPSSGIVTVNGAIGTVIYTSDANFNGSDSFVYEICDTTGLCDTASVNVQVSAVNDAPVASDQSVITSEDTSKAVTLSCSDPDGDAINYSVIDFPTQGSLSNSPPSLTYTPNQDYNGSDRFTFQCTDGTSTSNVAAVDIVVTALNDEPEAVSDSVITAEDTPVVINVPVNDTDVDGNLDVTSVSITSAPENGLASADPTSGEVTYAPGHNYSGPDSFVYEICDTLSLCDTAIVNISVSSVNDQPIALRDSASTPEDNPVMIKVVQNDADPDNNLDLSSVRVASEASNGSTTINPLTGAVTYTPNANFNGVDNFTYEICDTGGLCDIATVSVVITSLNDAPVALDDAATTMEDVEVSIDVALNDVDLDNGLNPASVTVVNGPINGTTSVDPSSGAVLYTPNANFNGTDNFVYNICDISNACDMALVSNVITPVNDPPVSNTILTTTLEDTSKAISLTCTDVDGDLIVLFNVITQPTNGILSGTPPDVVYQPSPDYSGSDESTYSCSDGLAVSDVATVSITVSDVNDPPVAVVNGPYSCVEGETITLSGASSFDPDGTIVQYAWDLDNNGSFETLEANPSYRCDFAGTYTVVLDVVDDDGASGANETTVAVAPLAVNAPPQATPLLINTLAGQSVSGTLPVSDADGDALACSLVTQPLNGTAVVNPDCTYSYTPNAGYVGEDEIFYEVTDGQALTAGLVAITVESAAPQVSISKSVISQPEYNVDDIITYVLTVQNAGPTATANLVVTDLMPASLSFTGSTDPNYDPVSGSWNIGSLQPGETATIDISAKIGLISLPASITNTAVISQCDSAILEANDPIQAINCLLTAAVASASIELTVPFALLTKKDAASDDDRDFVVSIGSRDVQVE